MSERIAKLTKKYRDLGGSKYVSNLRRFDLPVQRGLEQTLSDLFEETDNLRTQEYIETWKDLNDRYTQAVERGEKKRQKNLTESIKIVGAIIRRELLVEHKKLKAA